MSSSPGWERSPLLQQISSMEKKKPTLKAVSHSASQISHILWNPKVHHVHTSLPLTPALKHINPVHILWLWMYCNIILPSMPSSSNWYLSCRHTPRTPPSHLLDLINHEAPHYTLFPFLLLPPTQSHPSNLNMNTLSLFKFNSNRLTNQRQQFYKFLLDVYVSLNMFRASPRPSSGAYSCL